VRNSNRHWSCAWRAERVFAGSPVAEAFHTDALSPRSCRAQWRVPGTAKSRCNEMKKRGVADGCARQVRQRTVKHAAHRSWAREQVATVCAHGCASSRQPALGEKRKAPVRPRAASGATRRKAFWALFRQRKRPRRPQAGKSLGCYRKQEERPRATQEQSADAQHRPFQSRATKRAQRSPRCCGAAVLRCCGAAVSSNDEGRMRGPRVTAPAKQSVSLWRRRNAESVG